MVYAGMCHMVEIDIPGPGVSLGDQVHWSRLNYWLRQWPVSHPWFVGLVHCMYTQWVFPLLLIFAQTDRRDKIPVPSPSV